MMSTKPSRLSALQKKSSVFRRRGVKVPPGTILHALGMRSGKVSHLNKGLLMSLDLMDVKSDMKKNEALMKETRGTAYRLIWVSVLLWIFLST